MMGPHVTPDGACAAGRLSASDVLSRLNHAFRAEWGFSASRDLAAQVRDSIHRWAARSSEASIDVSAMSSVWLRMHETEHGKHRSEL
jgi:hypothetical protein